MTFLGIGAVALCLSIALQLQPSDAQCAAQVQRAADCFGQIDGKKEEARRSIQQSKDREKEAYKRVAEECLKGEGCQTSDPLDPKDVALQECTNTIQPDIYQGIVDCVKRSGESTFAIPLNARRARRGPRKFKKQARISVRAATRKCEKDLKKKSLSIKVLRCLRKNLPKKAASTGSATNVLGLVNKYQRFCAKKKQCEETLSNRCNGVVCRCVDEMRKSSSIQSKIAACVRGKVTARGGTYDGSITAVDMVDKVTYRGFRYCRHKGAQDICRTEDNPLLKLVNPLGGAFKGLAGGLGGSGGIASTLGKLFGGKK
jgi:hypothetical protein